MEYKGFIAWGKPDGGAGIGLTKPFDGNAASVGNGVMVALQAKDEEQVQRLYDIALANGGTCEGPPGPRGEGFYAGYFRDPDSNRSEEHTSELQSLMRISYAVFCLKKKNTNITNHNLTLK